MKELQECKHPTVWIEFEKGLISEKRRLLAGRESLYEVLATRCQPAHFSQGSVVSRQWKRTAHDEQLWELICMKHYHRSPMQLRAIVLALGGFRRLYSSHLWPLLKPAAPSSSAPPCFSFVALSSSKLSAPPPGSARYKARWGKDEVNLSLSLLSIKYFEKMSFIGGFFR
ncbi:hypothetical protein DH2020_011967 [Rehmannia glutinosa]|uniref:F-box protein n=1 Tax=Rehmannia glutinosa TaxID=99300 RepID=A0ABR0XF11_REHGL